MRSSYEVNVGRFLGVPVWKLGSVNDCVYFKPHDALRATLGISMVHIEDFAFIHT